nr:MAG TPA: hypothetical protein [Caudoviricetes sp.]
MTGGIFGLRAMNVAVTKERLTRFGLVSMLDYYTKRCVTC